MNISDHSFAAQMYKLPTQLMQYHLLPFLTLKTATTLTKASRTLLQTLRLHIQRKRVLSSKQFIYQSQPQPYTIGMSKHEMNSFN